MENLKISIIILLSVSAFLIMIFTFLSKKPLKMIFINILINLAVLLIINITTKYSGVRIPINLYTLIGCTVYGTPCIVGYLLLPLILM
ncbi:MAG: pro-sigmaK processing inhibitor BofA family protein [Clostridia bacterium]|nr:pro-sigmaK processing inhibitor BofA family protein [Clostridia bacterium]